MMAPALRKFSLTVHVTSSIGWIGAVAAFLVLAIIGLSDGNDKRARACYVAMDLIAWFLIVPLSFASPASGLVQALGTSWGLIRHYWIIFKVLITIPSTIFLLMHMRPIDELAAVAIHRPFLDGHLRPLQLQLAVDAAAAIVVLSVATVLALYKPRGMTPYGYRKQAHSRP